MERSISGARESLLRGVLIGTPFRPPAPVGSGTMASRNDVRAEIRVRPATVALEDVEDPGVIRTDSFR